MGRDRNWGQRLAGWQVGWSGLSLFSKILLVLSALASLAVVGILLIVGYLFIGGLSGGNDPTSVTGVLVLVAGAILVFWGLPSMLVCGLLWTGYAVSRRRRGRVGEPTMRPRS